METGRIRKYRNSANRQRVWRERKKLSEDERNSANKGNK